MKKISLQGLQDKNACQSSMILYHKLNLKDIDWDSINIFTAEVVDDKSYSSDINWLCNHFHLSLIYNVISIK